MENIFNMNTDTNLVISKGCPQLTLKFKSKTFLFDDKTGLKEINHTSLNNGSLSCLLVNGHKKNYLYCLNCNKKGHRHKNCRFPTNSYGFVIYKECEDHTIRYLMTQRKYTPVYVELLRAKYYEGASLNLKYLIVLIEEISLIERDYIIKYGFDYLWHNLWRWAGTIEQMQCIFEEYEYCKQKFNHLKIGHHYPEYGFLSFASLFQKYPTINVEPDWEFPKGRREEGESDQQCAIRECEEETTLDCNDYNMFLHVKPFQEKFTGINWVKYCNNYYLAELTNKKKLVYYDPTHSEQNKEIRKIGWFTEAEIRQLVNPAYKYRLRMFAEIDHLVTSMKKYRYMT
jgi:8-oxo-dGTP pyrophosphatase MutT (NUDIX family)